MNWKCGGNELHNGFDLMEKYEFQVPSNGLCSVIYVCEFYLIKHFLECPVKIVTHP